MAERRYEPELLLPLFAAVLAGHLAGNLLADVLNQLAALDGEASAVGASVRVALNGAL